MNEPVRVLSAAFRAAAGGLAELPPPLSVEVAFAGRSNVGKSSLLNCLLGRRNLVRVSSTPGCTRKLGFYAAELAGGAHVTLVDLPGYGFARRSKTEREAWASLIEGYLLGRATLAMVVAIVDVRRGLEDDDRDLLELCASKPRVTRPPLRTLVVATKLDKLPASRRKLELAKVKRVAGVPVVGFSAVAALGRDELWRQIREGAGL